MVDDAALVQDEDGVVELEVAEAVGDVDDDALVVRCGELVQEVDDLALGFRVEPAGDLVAEEEEWDR